MARTLPPGTDADLLRDASRAAAEVAAERLLVLLAASPAERVRHLALICEAATVAYLDRRRPTLPLPVPSAN